MKKPNLEEMRSQFGWLEQQIWKHDKLIKQHTKNKKIKLKKMKMLKIEIMKAMEG